MIVKTNNTAVHVPTVADPRFYTIPKGSVNPDVIAYNFVHAEFAAIPEGVPEVWENAFKNCKTIEEVVIPEGVTAIRSSAFEGCEKLRSVRIPEGVTRIEANAFKNCENLEFITIPASVKYVDKTAFEGCEKVTIPERFREIKVVYFNYLVPVRA